MITTVFKPVVFDLETYSNCFLAGFKLEDGSRATFEISDRRNDRDALLQTLIWFKDNGYTMVGFNSLGFDYHFIHKLLQNPLMFTAQSAYELCQTIINSQYGPRKFYPVQFTDRIIPQFDLFLMNHFDNTAKRTSLKKLEYNMRMDSIEDLPFEVGTILTFEQMDTLASYMHHDIDATEIFLHKCKEQIELRLDLKEKEILEGDVLNMSDVKIGEQFFVKRLGRDEFYTGKQKKQTVIKIKPIKEVVFPYIHFSKPEFDGVLKEFLGMVWQDKEEKFIYPLCNIRGLDYVYGRGGIHASKQGIYHSDEEYIIVDLDVTSMYPSIAIVNRMKPAHLSDRFIEEYVNLKFERLSHDKKSAMNKILKLALNGVFGNSGNPYSIFFDNGYLLGTTINGQLLISMLIDLLLDVNTLEVIQANTDGVTVRVHRSQLDAIANIKKVWSVGTALDLEEVTYKSFYCRDVNNYLAVSDNGKIKAKGAYAYPESESDYDGNWNKNYSCLIVQKVARKVLVEGANIYDELFRAIQNGDKHDFTLLHTNSSGGYLWIDGQRLGKNTRYIVSINGGTGTIVYPPKGIEGEYKFKNKLDESYIESVMKEIGPGVWDARIHNAKKSKHGERKVSLISDHLVTECNRIEKCDLYKLDLEWYASEIRKLTEVFDGKAKA